MNERISQHSEHMITPDTKKYWKKLAQIPWSKRGEIRTKLVPWIYTNDHKFTYIYSDIKNGMLHQHRSGRPRAAILSGVGSLLNITPIVDVDFYISVDRNSFVLDQVRRMVQNIQDAPTRDEYEQVDQRETFFADLAAMGADPSPYFSIETESFGAWHILSNDSIYRKSRNRLLTTPVFYSQGNFTSASYVESLGHSLSGVDVSYASFTDLAEWSPEFLDVVSYLPIQHYGVIVWSSGENQPEGNPIARISVGLDQYIDEQRSAIQRQQHSGMLSDYFRAHV